MVTETERLFYGDSYLREFEARVVAHGSLSGRATVALDRSAFYPDGGGQPADHGTLNGLAVVNVQAEDGIVWHGLERADDLAALPVGARVHGVIDWQRRHDHMQQHCGQHLLTAAFVTACGLTTISFHLGERNVTIDLDTPTLSPEQGRAAEALANTVIWEDRPIVARFVSPAELAQLPLRKPPSVQEHVRVVSIANFDHSACGGTHPRSSGSVGAIVLLGWARQRAGVRVEFACGGRALSAFRRLHWAAEGAAAVLSVGVDDLPATTARLQATQQAALKELAQANTALDAAEAHRLYGTAEPAGAARIVCTALPSLSAERLRGLARAIAAQPGGVALIGVAGAPGERCELLVACGPDSGRDARAIVQVGLPFVGGRGGGSTAIAQGAGPRAAGLDAALAAMLQLARGG